MIPIVPLLGLVWTIVKDLYPVVKRAKDDYEKPHITVTVTDKEDSSVKRQ